VNERERLVIRAGAITIGVNLVLTLLRAGAAIFSGSSAVLADAANSGTDVLATLVVLGGTRIAALPPDQDHPYGHEKAEPVAAKIVGLIVVATGLLTAWGSYGYLRIGGTEIVGISAAVVTAGSIIAKEVLARFLKRVGGATRNQAIMADASNQRADVFISLAALVGALGGRFGLPLLDPIMGLLVSGLILKVGIGLYWRSVDDLMDRAPEPETLAAVIAAAGRVKGVLSVDQVKARVFGSGIYVDCKVGVDRALTVEEGHRIATLVKDSVRLAVPTSRDVLVHVNPSIRQQKGQADSE